VVERVGRQTAVGAAVLPCLKYTSPKPLLI
jgi:hypothetical protein